MSHNESPARPLLSPRTAQPTLFFTVLICLICLTAMHFIHAGWYPLMGPPAPGAVRSPSQHYAPDVYRMLMPAVWRTAEHAIPIELAWIAAGLDFLFLLPALLLLARLAVEDLRPALQQTLTLALFVAFVQFPVDWIVPWQRPETTPTALFLAFALFCVSRASRQPLWTAALLAATFVQAFVRSDAPFILGAAITLLSFLPRFSTGFGSRRGMFLRGAAIAAIAAAVQIYLQFFLYRGIPYPPGTTPIQFATNLRPHYLTSALLALAPFPLAFWIARRSSTGVGAFRLRAIDATAILAALLYLPIWFAVGLVAEVRIFVPFLLLLCIPAARVSAHFLLGAAAQSPGDAQPLRDV